MKKVIVIVVLNLTKNIKVGLGQKKVENPCRNGSNAYSLTLCFHKYRVPFGYVAFSTHIF